MILSGRRRPSSLLATTGTRRARLADRGWRWLAQRLRTAGTELFASHLANVSPLGRTAASELGSEISGFDPLHLLRRFDQPEAPRVTRLQLADLHTFLVDDVLLKVDHASMACGVEVRVPFLDHKLVELAFSIDSRALFAEGERKALLKRAAASWLPPEILTSRKKGFSIPLDAWFREGLRAPADALLPEGVLVSRGIAARPAVRKALASQKSPDALAAARRRAVGAPLARTGRPPLRDLLSSAGPRRELLYLSPGIMPLAVGAHFSR